MHTHPTRYDYEAHKQWREIDDERQKEALKRFYARNAAPHYSKFPRWFKNTVAVVGCLVMIAVGAVCLWLWMAL